MEIKSDIRFVIAILFALLAIIWITWLSDIDILSVVLFSCTSVVYFFLSVGRKRQNKDFPADTTHLHLIRDVTTRSRTRVLVYEVIMKGAFADFFGSLTMDLKRLAFESHSQIDEFISENIGWLKTSNFGAFFLFVKNVSEGVEYYVVHVDFRFEEPRKHDYELSFSVVWPDSIKRRFVVQDNPLK